MIIGLDPEHAGFHGGRVKLGSEEPEEGRSKVFVLRGASKCRDVRYLKQRLSWCGLGVGVLFSVIHFCENTQNKTKLWSRC